MLSGSTLSADQFRKNSVFLLYFRLDHWEKRFQDWKFQLKKAVEENQSKIRINNESEQDVLNPKHSKKSKKGIDFKHLTTLDANTEMLQYVQEKCQDYVTGLDQKFPEGRQFIGSIVGGCIRYVPCGSYNKDNSCDQSFVHDDSNGEKRIHSCALCYFAMGGMINTHRLIQCPLLAYDNT